MSRAENFIILFVLFALAVFLTGCGTNSPHSSTSGSGSGSGTTSGSSGTSSGSGSGSSSGTSGSSNTAPGFGVGTGSSGQTTPAKFLYANPLPGGAPDAALINSNGTITLQPTASGFNNGGPRAIAIDPSGSFLFQATAGGFNNAVGGLFVYVINRSNGSLGNAVGTYLRGTPLLDDIVDNSGKFVYAFGVNGGIFGFSNASGALTPVPGSPFAAPAPTAQFGNLMTVDQTNKFLYVSTSSGIAAFSINQSTGQLAALAGSPFGSDVPSPSTEVITPNNSFLYVLSSKSASSIFGFSVDQTSGALTPLPGSPFNSGGCGTVVPLGTISIPFPDNMTIASAGKFMYDNCGIYSIDESSGAITQVSSKGPGNWPVIDPTGNFLWAISTNQSACFSCDVGVQAYSVDPNTGAFTAIANGYTSITDTEIGDLISIAITK